MSNEAIPIHTILAANKGTPNYGTGRIMAYNGAKIKSGGVYGKAGSSLRNRGVEVAGANRVNASMASAYHSRKVNTGVATGALKRNLRGGRMRSVGGSFSANARAVSRMAGGNMTGVRRLPGRPALGPTAGAVGAAGLIVGASLIGSYAGKKLGNALVNRTPKQKAATRRFNANMRRAGHKGYGGGPRNAVRRAYGFPGRRGKQARDSRGRFK